MDNMVGFMKRAAEKCGFIRESFVEDNIPTLPSNVLVIPFFGSISSCVTLSQFILRQYKETRSNKYLILASWPGYRYIFPYVNEFWSPKDNASVQSIASGFDDFCNSSNLMVEYNRFLNNHFENVLGWDELREFYSFGFTPKYWDTFRKVRSFLPDVPSSSKLPEDFRNEISRKNGRKISIFPSKKLRSWQNGKNVYLPVHRDFWIALTNRLLKEGFVPVVYQNWFTYDLSTEFTDRCIWLTTKDMGLILSGLRASGCVLDIHSGIGRLAAFARCPSLVVDERQRFVHQKEYELNELTPINTPRQYLFSFSTRLMTGGEQEWNLSLLDGIVSRLEKWLPNIENGSWGATGEMYEEVSYDTTRNYNKLRLGVRFIRKY